MLLQWVWKLSTANWKVLHEGIKASKRKDFIHLKTFEWYPFLQATPAEVPDYDDNSVAPFNPNAPIVEVTKILYQPSETKQQF